MGDVYVPVSVVSDRLCGCGCGGRTMVSPRTMRSKGWVKGVGRRFVKGHGPRGARKLRVAVRWVEEDRGFETPCHIWQLGVDVHGYGKVTVLGERLKAHRVAFVAAGGVIPDGHDVHHRCEQKDCVNAAHMQPLTPEEHAAVHNASR